MNHKMIVAEIVECSALIMEHKKFTAIEKTSVLWLEYEAKNAPESERAKLCEIMVKMQGMLYGIGAPYEHGTK